MRRSRYSIIVISLLVVALAVAATISIKLYGEARSSNASAMQWKADAAGWQSMARRSAHHDEVVTQENRQLVRRYNHLVSVAEARQHKLLLAVQRAQKAATAKQAAAAAAAAQATASQSYSSSASSSAASASAAQPAPSVQPAPAQAPAAAAS